MYCANCGAVVGAGARFCTNCGAPQSGKAPTPPPWASEEGDAPYRPAYEVDAYGNVTYGSDSRSSSGYTPYQEFVQSPVYVQPPYPVTRGQTNLMSAGYRNKWVTSGLCFFLGVVGAHKFYEGKIGLGLLYLFTGGLFGIGALVDLIRALLRPDTYYLP